MDRKDFYYRQKVTEDELDDAFDYVEQADLDQFADAGLVGIMSGGSVSEASGGADETVDITAAIAYDKNGQRLYWAAGQNLDVSEDEDTVSTRVAGSGNEKIISVFAKFKRVTSDQRTDGNDQTVYFDQAEGFEFIVRQGAEATAGSATPVALDSEYILLCDIRRAYNDNTIANTDITPPGGSYALTGGNRREDAFVIKDGTTEVSREGTAEAAIQDVVDYFVGATAAENVGIAVAATWENADTISGTDVDAVIEEIVTELAAKTSDAVCGADRVGCYSDDTWENGQYIDGGGGAVAGSVREAVEHIVVQLAEKTAAPNCGTDRIGAYTSSTWENGQYIDGGGSAVAGSAQEAIENIILQLAEKTDATNCGADRVGSFAHTSTGPANGLDLSTGSIMEQLIQISNAYNPYNAINSWSAKNTFTGGVEFSTTNDVTLNGVDLLWDGSGTVYLESKTSWSGTAFGLSAQTQAGTGGANGAKCEVFARQGQNVASGTQSNGGDLRLGPGPRGGNGTAGTGYFGKVEIPLEDNSTKQEFCIEGNAPADTDTVCYSHTMADGNAVLIEFHVMLWKADETEVGCKAIRQFWADKGTPASVGSEVVIFTDGDAQITWTLSLVYNAGNDIDFTIGNDELSTAYEYSAWITIREFDT